MGKLWTENLNETSIIVYILFNYLRLSQKAMRTHIHHNREKY